jgi:hypothetical protein
MWKKLELNFGNGAALVTRNTSEAMVRLIMGFAQSLGVRSQVVSFVLLNLVSVAMKMFSHLISFIKIFYKLCTLNIIYSNNVAISCIII